MEKSGWLVASLSTLGMVCFIPVLQLTSVSNVAIIIATGPFVAAALAWIWLREVVRLPTLLASLAALCGVVIIVGDARASSDVLGIGLACLMTLDRHPGDTTQAVLGVAGVPGDSRSPGACPGCPGDARLSHMEFSNESSLRTQGPIRRGLSLRHLSRGLFSLLRPGVMGPCVRRDDLLRDCTRPRPHQRTAQFSHMR